MASQAWIDAASRTSREPVLIMSVETVDAVKAVCTTRSDWEAEKALTPAAPFIYDVSLVTHPYKMTLGVSESGGYSNPGEVVNTWLDSGQVQPNAFQARSEVTIDLAGVWQLKFHQDVWITAIGAMVEWPKSLATNPEDSFATWCQLKLKTSTGTLLGTSASLYVHQENYTGDYIRGTGVFLFTSPVIIAAETVVEGGPDDLLINGSPAGRYWASPSTYANVFFYNKTTTLQTMSLDLGSVPTVASVFNVTDTIPAGCSLTYAARGSDDNSTWSNLGAVVDGGNLAAHRYYDFTATFTIISPAGLANRWDPYSGTYVNYGLAVPALDEISVSGGESQFKVYGTHEDMPTTGVIPFLQASLGSLTSKLELMKLGSIGEVSPKLFYLADTFALIRDNYLRNKAISVKMGFVGLDSVDYEPLFTGLWLDASIDHYRGSVAIKTRSIMARFQKVKLPKETTGTRDESTCIPIEWQGANIIQAMLDIIDLLGIPDRYINRASATTLISGARSGNNWKVSRRLDKDSKEEALKLLEELSVLSGVFLLQQPNGKMEFLLYDPAAATVAEIDTDIATFGSIELGQADLFTRQQILYGLRHEGDLETGSVRGAWSGSSVEYARNDSVTRSGVTWYCLQNHTSSAATEPAVGSGYRPYWATEWTTATVYVAGETVLRSGPLYTCSSGHTSGAATEPGVGADWRTVWIAQPAKKGSSEEDFYNTYILVNQAAEVAWGLNADVAPGNPDYQKNPGYQKTWMDKWSASAAARTALASRLDSWYATPKIKTKASNLPPHFYDVGLGKFIGVSGLMLPVSGAVWGTPCSNKKFMVMSKNFDPAKCTVSFDLQEV